MSAKHLRVPAEAQDFADHITHTIMAGVDASGVDAETLCLILGRVAGLAVSAAEIDGAPRVQVLDNLRGAAVEMACAADGGRQALAALFSGGGHA